MITSSEKSPLLIANPMDVSNLKRALVGTLKSGAGAPDLTGFWKFSDWVATGGSRPTWAHWPGLRAALRSPLIVGLR
jgi:hypothetical protein